MSLTFMAKFDQREGNSCHIHLSLRTPDGDPVFPSGRGGDFSPTGEHFVAGLLDGIRELTLFFAPNINSYKRYVAGSFAPTAIRWGRDNRTCAVRVVGHGASLRLENRVPGGDVNPYLACAAVIAAGLNGIERELPLEPAFIGNAYQTESARLPSTLRDALTLWERSELALRAFGDEVVEHYAKHGPRRTSRCAQCHGPRDCLPVAYVGAGLFYPDESTGALSLPADPAQADRGAVAPSPSADGRRRRRARVSPGAI